MSTIRTLHKGREAFRQHAWSDAYSLLSDSDGENQLAPDDLERLAVAAYLVGKDSESIDAWTRAHQELLNSGDNEQAARCAFWLGMQLMNKGEHARGGGWIARSKRLVDDSKKDCVEQGFLLLPVALQRLGGGDADGAFAAFRQADEIGERFNNPELMVLARLGCGQSLIGQNKIQEGTTLLDEAMVAVESNEVSAIAVGIVYCAVVETCQKIYDLRRAQEWTAVLSDWCDSQPDMVPFRGQCLVRRAEIMQLHGEWSEAMNEVLRACKLFSQPPGEPMAGAAFYCKGELHRVKGEFDEAEEAYRNANNWGKKPQPGLALLRLAQGQVDAAKTAILRLEDESRDYLSRSRMLPAYVDIMLAAEEIAKAQTAAAELIKIADDLNSPFLRAIADRTNAAVLFANGESNEALDKMRQAWEALKEFDAPYETARTRFLIGLACRETGDEEAAVMELDAARWLFLQLGATYELSKIDSLSTKSESSHGLTQRELEVLRLIATGKTNKAIASELFISERTVDRHVSNIFMKLDVTSRAAATAYAYQHHLI